MFWHFSQNNSGGSFDFRKNKLTHHVIIEADTLDEALDKADDLGIYFNGVEEGNDCGCCGDRWHEPWWDAGKEEPMVYGTPVAKLHEEKHAFKFIKGPEAYVHYKDGRVEGYWE